jgi:hypothetical protein
MVGRGSGQPTITPRLPATLAASCIRQDSRRAGHAPTLTCFTPQNFTNRSVPVRNMAHAGFSAPTSPYDSHLTSIRCKLCRTSRQSFGLGYDRSDQAITLHENP